MRSLHAILAVFVAACVLLTACGGSSGGAADAPTSPPVEKSAPYPGVTLSAYAAGRSTALPAQPAPSDIATVAAQSRAMAAQELRLSKSDPDSPASLLAFSPVLSMAHRHSLLAMAEGQTREELMRGNFGDSEAWLLGVTRSVTSQQGLTYGNDFLTAQGAASLLHWEGAEVDFARDGEPTSLLPSGLGLGLEDTRRLRLVQIDRLAASLNLPGTRFAGLFQADGSSELGRHDMARFPAASTRLSRAGYTADAIALGSRVLVKIQPQGSLQSFVGSELATALEDISTELIAIAPDGRTPIPKTGLPSADLILSYGERSLDFEQSWLVRRQGATLAYSETQAQLTRMTGSGGYYALSSTREGALSANETGIRFSLTGVTAAAFSPLNTYAPSPISGNVRVIFVTTPPTPQCITPLPVPDLRPHLLLVIGPGKIVEVLMALPDLGMPSESFVLC